MPRNCQVAINFSRLEMCSIVLLSLTIGFSLTSGLIVKTNVDDLVAVVQIFRHGQRNPNSWYPTDPWSNQSLYELGPGQLTKVGKQMHYELGTFTRGRYGNYMPREYSPDWFKAQTTDVDRTHMSCQSNLAAIFPPTQNETWNKDLPWQPIPVHPTVSTVISTIPNCAIYSTEKAKIVVKDALYVAINEEFADLYTYLSNYTGKSISTVVDVSSIHDTLHIEKQLGFDLPSWTSSVYPEPLHTLTGYAFLANSYTTEMKRLSAGSWLKTAIYDYFTNIFNNPSSYQKFQMWSAHDTNIAAILNTLGAFDPHYPAFASTLYFELRNQTGTPIINIYHKDDDLDIFEPITVSGCRFNCPLSDFAVTLSDFLIDSDTWSSECAATSTAFTDAEVDTSDDEVAKALERIQIIIEQEKN